MNSIPYNFNAGLCRRNGHNIKHCKNENYL